VGRETGREYDRNRKRETGGVANVIDGTNSPRESDKGEHGVDVKGKLSSVATCTCEEGYKAVYASDLVEHGK